jgi:eukaryotic-like serine/threonine-protein kinase
MSSPPVTLEVGSTIGDYQIISLIGRGGMGQVFKVRNVISDRVEAMKVLPPDLDPDAKMIERFLREIKVVACLEHPNIAALRTALRVGNQILMIMEFVEGESLQPILLRSKIDPMRASSLTLQVLDALSYAHGRGIVHRDVKPSNILVGRGEWVKLTDFGIASRSGDPKLTAAGMALGSLHYMSPEQMKAEPVDERSDLYSVGATLYEMVTGQPPVYGRSFYAIMRAHMEERPTPAIELVPGIPPALSRVIDKALDKRPEARFQTAKEFRVALNSVDSTTQPQPAATVALQSRPISPPVSIESTMRTLDHTRGTGSRTTSPAGTGSKSWDPQVLENLRKNLAVYVGPMAKVLVNRSAKNATTLEALCQALAAEISSPADREKFLRSQAL